MNTLKLRNAIESDCDTLFEWTNEKEVRENSLHSEHIDYKVHCEWYENALANPNCYIFIAEINRVPVGIGRLDIKENAAARVSVSVAKKYRSMGIGTKIIIELQALTIPTVKSFYADVKTDNLKSVQMLQKAGFRSEDGKVLKFVWDRPCPNEI